MSDPDLQGSGVLTDQDQTAALSCLPQSRTEQLGGGSTVLSCLQPVLGSRMSQDFPIWEQGQAVQGHAHTGVPRVVHG